MSIRSNMLVAQCDNCRKCEIIYFSRHNLLPDGWIYMCWRAEGFSGSARNSTGRNLKLLLLEECRPLELRKPGFFHFCSEQCKKEFLETYDFVFQPDQRAQYEEIFNGWTG